MRRMKLYRLLAAVTVLSLAVPAVAAPVAAAEKATPYVVVMAAEPITAYDGGVRGLTATKPAEGRKVNRGSLAVRDYQAFLRRQHDTSLRQGGVAPTRKLHDYSFALNGYAALLTPSQVDRIKVQKGVVRVLEDQMRHAQTDSTPRFLQLTADGGPYDRGVTGENVVVGVIDTGAQAPIAAEQHAEAIPPARGRDVGARRVRIPEEKCFLAVDGVVGKHQDVMFWFWKNTVLVQGTAEYAAMYESARVQRTPHPLRGRTQYRWLRVYQCLAREYFGDAERGRYAGSGLLRLRAAMPSVIAAK